MSQQQPQQQDDAHMTFNGKRVDIWAPEPDPSVHAATLPQRSAEMQQVFDEGEIKKPLTEATRHAVQAQQQALGVENPIQEARLLGSGSFTGPGVQGEAKNVGLLQEKGFNRAVDTIEDTQGQQRGTIPRIAQDPSYNADDDAHLRQNNIQPVRNPQGFQDIGDKSFINMPGQEQHTQTAVAAQQPGVTLATTLPRLERSISNKAEPATTDNFLATNDAQHLPTPQKNPIEQAAFADQTMYSKQHRFAPRAESSSAAAERAPGERPPSMFNPRPGDQPSTPPIASSSTQPPAAPAAPTAEEAHKSHFKKVLGCIFCSSKGPAGGSDVELPARPGRSTGQQAGAPSSGAPQAGAPAARRR